MKRMALLWFPIVAWIVSLNLLSCGGGGGGSILGTLTAARIVTTPIGTVDDEARALVIQSDGKLVAAGYSYNSTTSAYEFALVRYNTDGTLDTTGFGPVVSGTTRTGFVTTAIGTGDDEAFALAIQSDQKLVAAGYSNNGTQKVLTLVRYNTDGTLDTTGFGPVVVNNITTYNGFVTTAIGTGDDEAFALTIQSDQKLVAAGYSNSGTQKLFTLVRYNTDGTLDTTGFGPVVSGTTRTGFVTTAIGTVDDKAFALVIQPDGKLVAAGYSKIGAKTEFALVRYNTDGTLDTTFNTTGKVTTTLGNGGEDEAKALAIQLDGKLVAAGYSNNGIQNVFALVRYNTDGTLDTTGFGPAGTGIVTTPSFPLGGSDVAFALRIQSDGKLVAAGFSNNSPQNVFERVFALARYNPTGSLDIGFGGGAGFGTTAIGTVDDEAFALAIQSDGQLVAAGYSKISTTLSTTQNEFALVSYLP